jgi:anti-anti-sigma factor
MRIESIGKTLMVSGLSTLNSVNAGSFRDNVRASVQPHHTRIDVDMSLTGAIDSAGLGALVSVHRFFASRQGQVRLLNPVPVVKKVLDLTQLSKSFEITQG